MAKNAHAAGASKSINKTISEIEGFLQNAGVNAPAGKLRPMLHASIADLAEKWYRRGFKRGCIEAKDAYKETGKFPKEVTYDGSRELFIGQKRDLELVWRAKPKKKKKKGK